MSGLFHRLAAQAIGRGRAVHSAARLAYTPPPPLPEQTAEEAAPALVRHQPPAMAAVRAAAPAPRQSTRQAQASPDNGTPVSQPTSSPIPRAAPKDRPGDPLDGRPTAASRRSPEEPGSEAVLEPLSTTAREQNPTIFRDDPGEPIGAAPLMTLASPLLPPHPAQRNGLERRHPEPPSLDRRASFEETTEVHVNIGRIEVTAVQEAPPPRRGPPRTSKSMSLEEYLARRRGGPG
jgi:hypothetical protein